MIEKEFILYEEALALKELEFDEPCFAVWFTVNKQLIQQVFNDTRPHDKDLFTLAPTFSQAFRWFREKKLMGLINPIDDWNSWSFSILAEDCMSPFFEMIQGGEYKSYEEAEFECLKKLIEIAKQGGNNE